MSFFADYDVDLNDFNDTGFDVPDGNYDFEITGAETRVGTRNDEDAVNITVTYRLENANGEVFSTTSWFKMPADPARPTRRESISMTELKKLLIGAGVKEEDLNSAGPEDLEGMTGTLRLVSSENKKTGTVYQNVRDVVFDSSESSAPAKASEAPKAAPAASPAKKSNPFGK